VSGLISSVDKKCHIKKRTSINKNIRGDRKVMVENTVRPQRKNSQEDKNGPMSSDSILHQFFCLTGQFLIKVNSRQLE
jgi:hypothetical protein